jgi:hypothetical protein
VGEANRAALCVVLGLHWRATQYQGVLACRPCNALRGSVLGRRMSFKDVILNRWKIAKDHIAPVSVSLYGW